MALRSIVKYGLVEEHVSDGEDLDIVDEDELLPKKTPLDAVKQSVILRNSPSPGSQSVTLRPTPSLVSYDDGGSDDEGSDHHESYSADENDVEIPSQGQSPVGSPSSLDTVGSSVDLPEIKVTSGATGRSGGKTVTLPPEPEGRCSRKLQEKIERMLERKRMGKLSLNSHVQKKKDFRNPSIYEKLVSFVGIKETGTNYPKELFNPDCWKESSFYDQLAVAQKEYHTKKEEEKHKRAQVEFVTGTKKPPLMSTGTVTATAADKKPRKTKFDVKPDANPTATDPTSAIKNTVPSKKSKVAP